MNFLIKLVLMAVAVMAGANFIPGVHVSGFKSALIAAVVLALLNTFVKPILQVLTIPVTILTLGLFLLVINVIIIYLAARLVDGFSVNGFIPALIFSIVLSIASSILNGIFD